jgi:hypothetical protein
MLLMDTRSAKREKGLFELARHFATFIHDLDSGRWPGLSESDRQRLRGQTASRGAELLRQAAERGFDDRALLESGESAPLRNQSGPGPVEANPKPSVSVPTDKARTSE